MVLELSHEWLSSNYYTQDMTLGRISSQYIYRQTWVIIAKKTFLCSTSSAHATLHTPLGRVHLYSKSRYLIPRLPICSSRLSISSTFIYDVRLVNGLPIILFWIEHWVSHEVNSPVHRAIHDDCITQRCDDYPIVDQSQPMMRSLDLRPLYCRFAPGLVGSFEMCMNHLEGWPLY